VSTKSELNHTDTAEAEVWGLLVAVITGERVVRRLATKALCANIGCARIRIVAVGVLPARDRTPESRKLVQECRFFGHIAIKPVIT